MLSVAMLVLSASVQPTSHPQGTMRPLSTPAHPTPHANNTKAHVPHPTPTAGPQATTEPAPVPPVIEVPPQQAQSQSQPIPSQPIPQQPPPEEPQGPQRLVPVGCNPGGVISEIASLAAADEVIKTPAVILFSATTGCPYCSAMATAFDGAASAHAKEGRIKFYVVDAALHPDIGDAFKVGGTHTGQVSGSRPLPEVRYFYGGRDNPRTASWVEKMYDPGEKAFSTHGLYYFIREAHERALKNPIVYVGSSINKAATDPPSSGDCEQPCKDLYCPPGWMATPKVCHCECELASSISLSEVNATGVSGAADAAVGKKPLPQRRRQTA